MLDARVVADLEVQEADLAEASPVPPVQHTGLFEADCSGDDLASIAGRDKSQVTLEVPPKQGEKLLRQILAPPVQLLDSGQVNLEHGRKHRVSDFVSGQYPHLDARVPDLVAFVSDRRPPLVL